MASIISQAETNISLALTEANSKVKNLLSPSGAVGATVDDILTAASDVALVANTANAILSDFLSPTNDPIQTSFSNGQPYAGTFITAPTVLLTPLSLASQLVSSSTSALSLLACGQIEALAERVGFAILNDLGLAQAMSFLFNEVSTIANLAFSIALDVECICGCTEVTPFYYPANDTSVTYAIPSITPNPNTENLSAFVSTISSSFPNTPAIGAIAESVWVDGYGVSVGTGGTPISGVPQNIDNGVYNDINNSVAGLIPGSNPVVLVDYSYQQNLLNTVLALAIDNGLIATITELLASDMATAVSIQVILNRLGSVAARGDTALFLALITALGATNIPNKTVLVSNLIASLQPTDLPSNTSSNGLGTTTGSISSNGTSTAGTTGSSGIGSVIFMIGSTTINTSTNAKTLAELVSDINAILILLGLTIQEVFSQSTCDSVFCSQSLLNVKRMSAANQTVLEALMPPTTVQMAQMFAA